MTSIVDSYKLCHQITKEQAKNFYYGIRLLPTERQDSLCAVYAFFRHSDDLSDDEAISNKAERLRQWRAALEPGSKSDHPILPAFHDTVRRFSIPLSYFHELIDGTEADLTVARYQTFDDLYQYCYQVASTVGLVCVHIFGFDGSQVALEQAEQRGIAFQLTNILRDVAEDAGRQRVYLPLEDLERFEVEVDHLLAGRPGPGFAPLLAFQVERARHYYHQSEPLKERVDPASRPSLVAMTRIYQGLLDKIEQMGERTLIERASLNKMEKLKLAGSGMLQSLKA